MEFHPFQHPPFPVANQVLRPQDCAHEERELRNKPDKNQKPVYLIQCLACGQKVGARVRASEVSASKTIPAWDSHFEQRVWSEYHEKQECYKALRRFYHEQQRQIGREQWIAQYNRYLDSQEWKERRRQVLNRAGNVCEGCLSNKATEVHHLTYQNIGDEFLFELVAVCHPCHERLHQPAISTFLERNFSWQPDETTPSIYHTSPEHPDF